jgi:hypothetical protein
MDSFYSSVPLFMSLYQNGLRAIGSMNPKRAFYPEEWRVKFKLPKDTFKVQQNVKLPQLLAVCHTNKQRTKHYLTTATPVNDGKVKTHHVAAGRLKQSAAAPRYPVPETRIQYNNRMSGVDLNNQYCARPTLWRAARRWWISIFLHFINVSVVNSWYLRKKFGQPTTSDMSLPAFRLALMHELVDGFTARKRIGRTPDPQHINAPPSIIKLPSGGRTGCSVCHYRRGPAGSQVDFGSQTSFCCSKCGFAVCGGMSTKNGGKTKSCWDLHCSWEHPAASKQAD